MRRTIRELLVCALLLVVTVLSMTAAPLEERVPAQPQALAQSSTTPAAPPTAVVIATSSSAPTHTATARPATPQPTATLATVATATPTLAPTPFPFDTHPERDRFIYVDQVTQRMWVFEQGQLVRDIPCSTGLPTDTTYTEPWTGEVGRYWGTFFAFDVFADEAWYLYPSLGSILVHSLPYVMRNGYKIYLDRDALGVRPASHGCIRIAPEDAAWFTAWDPEGALMTITDPYLEMWAERLAQ